MLATPRIFFLLPAPDVSLEVAAELEGAPGVVDLGLLGGSGVRGLGILEGGAAAVVDAALGGLGVGEPEADQLGLAAGDGRRQAVRRRLFAADDLLGEDQDRLGARRLAHAQTFCGVDPLEQHPRGGRVPVGEHHRVDAERRRALHPGDLGDLLHDRAVLAEIGGVLQHEHVGVDAQHLLAELGLEAAGDAHHGGQRGHAQGHAEDGERRPDRDERALLRPQVPERDLERVAHARGH